MSVERNICKKYIRTFTAALFIATKKCKQLDCSLTSRRKNKVWHIPNGILHNNKRRKITDISNNMDTSQKKS